MRKVNTPRADKSLHEQDAERRIEELICLERERLLREAGLLEHEHEPFKRPFERPFTRSERSNVTILFGGLTSCHDRLLQAVGRSVGLQLDIIPTPTKQDYQTGREYADMGMCNPTYFTIGALINYLRSLREVKGLSTQRILDEYVFLFPGGCGPCRFGMYEAQYRLALRNSGFDGFRVLVFEQGRFGPKDEESGMEMSARLYLLVYHALMIGDVLNELACQIRPYEVEPGRTDRVFETVIERVCEHLRSRDTEGRKPGWIAWGFSKLFPSLSPHHAQLLLDLLLGDETLEVLRYCARYINDTIEVDFTRPKPICKITGEFWAQTTEGDGNFRMFSFLESQGAEVVPEPVTTWILYLAAHARTWLLHRRELRRGQEPGSRRNLRARIGARLSYYANLARLAFALKLTHREYDRVREALGATTLPQADQRELERLAKPYYDPRCAGGEGHLEVAKNIYYTGHKLAHMVMSLKPFGCLPSTQSDGAQAAVVAQYPDMIFIPIETSGEGDVNAYSRVQMALGEAKTRCKEDFKVCLEQSGYSLEEIRAYIASHPELRRPIQRIPRRDGVIGRAANYVLHVTKLMDSEKRAGGPEKRFADSHAHRHEIATDG